MKDTKKAPAGTAIPNAGNQNDQTNYTTFSDSLQVAYYKPGEPMRVEQVKDELPEFQGLVGGNIELAYLAKDIALVCNEEGRLKGLELNRLDIAGPFVVVGIVDDHFRSLKEAEIDVLREVLR